MFEVFDSLTMISLGIFETFDLALYHIRFYCVQHFMNGVGLFEQDFVSLSINNNYVVYENPPDQLAGKPCFIIRKL